MGSGAHLLVVGSEPPYEQGLREVVRYQRGVCLRGDGSNHGEALSSCLGFIKQFLAEICTEVLYTIHTNGASAYGHGCKVEGYLIGGWGFREGPFLDSR